MGDYDAKTLPHKWALGLMIAQRIETILANAAYDAEGLVAPRELWFAPEEELKDWYEDRQELYKQQRDY